MIAISILLLLATYLDIKTRRIPNWLTYPYILLALIRLDSYLLFVALIGLVLALIFRTSIGGGDIKLGVAVALWSHILNLSQYWLLYSLLLGSAYALAMKKKSIPFAPFMATGFMLANIL